jgi:formamidopyrimidine-DNA glycosylase
MPELPEVEVTRQSFAGRIRGARIHAVRVGKPLRWPLGVAPETLVSQAVGEVTRRGKYLWMALDRGGLLMHLGMSGALAFSESAGEPGPHDHFDLVTGQGTLRLTDPRRFGAVVWSPAIDDGPALKLLAGLGLEPFDPAFTGRHLYDALRGRRVAIKQALLGGAIVVGAGNIYACEALFEAGIDPRTRSDRVSLARSPARSNSAVRPCATSAMRMAWPASFNCRRGSTGGKASRACVLRPRCLWGRQCVVNPQCVASAPYGASSRASARPTFARCASAGSHNPAIIRACSRSAS